MYLGNRVSSPSIQLSEASFYSNIPWYNPWWVCCACGHTNGHQFGTIWRVTGKKFQGDHRAVLPVGCSFSLQRLIEQNEREIMTSNILMTAMASAMRAGDIVYMPRVCSFIKLTSISHPVKNPVQVCGGSSSLTFSILQSFLTLTSPCQDHGCLLSFFSPMLSCSALIREQRLLAII